MIPMVHSRVKVSLNTGAELVTTRGDVHVVGVDPKGEFIRLLNASDKVTKL